MSDDLKIDRKSQQKVAGVLKKNYARVIKSFATSAAAKKLMEEGSIVEFRAGGRGISRIVKSGFKVKQGGREYLVVAALIIGVEPTSSPPPPRGDPQSNLILPRGAGEIVKPTLRIIDYIKGDHDGPQRKRAANSHAAS